MHPDIDSKLTWTVKDTIWTYVISRSSATRANISLCQTDVLVEYIIGFWDPRCTRFQTRDRIKRAAAIRRAIVYTFTLAVWEWKTVMLALVWSHSIMLASHAIIGYHPAGARNPGKVRIMFILVYNNKWGIVLSTSMCNSLYCNIRFT